MVINLAVNSMPMLVFGKCPGRHRLKTLEPSSAAGSHFHYSDGIMSAMVSNHWRLKCLPNCLFRHRSKKTSKLSITGVCEGNSPMTGEFPAQRARNAENVSIWWCRMFFVQCISLKECLYCLVCRTTTNLDMSHVNVMQTFINVIELSLFELARPDYSAESQLTQWQILPVQPTVLALW